MRDSTERSNRLVGVLDSMAKRKEIIKQPKKPYLTTSYETCYRSCEFNPEIVYGVF